MYCDNGALCGRPGTYLVRGELDILEEVANLVQGDISWHLLHNEGMDTSCALDRHGAQGLGQGALG